MSSSSSEISFTCGFRPKHEVFQSELPFSHMTGLRLGPWGSFDESEVLTILGHCRGMVGEVIGHAQWGPNFVLLLELPAETLKVLSGLDIFSKPERDEFLYKYIPEPSSNEKLKEPHISLGKRLDLSETFPIGTKIQFYEAFIKKEGKCDPKKNHIIPL
jgi:hypothetical protein